MRARDGFGLHLDIPVRLEDAISRAASVFNERFQFRLGGPARIRFGELLIDAYDLADFLRFVERTDANELDLFRFKRQAELQISGMSNDGSVLECLRRVHWNHPDL